MTNAELHTAAIAPRVRIQIELRQLDRARLSVGSEIQIYRHSVKIGIASISPQLERLTFPQILRCSPEFRSFKT